MGHLTAIKRGATLFDLERMMLESALDQPEMPITHHFSDGVYVRELFIPKGTMLIGKRHRKETMNILLKGSLSVFVDEDGKIVGENGKPVVKRIDAPAIFVSPPFSKKMGYAHEDTIFLNIHTTSETDLEKIEDEFIIKEEEYLDFISSTQIEGV